MPHKSIISALVSTPEPRRLSRRAVIALGAPALGAVGITAGLRQRPAVAADEAPGLEACPEDAGLTAHRRAYYSRARF